MRPGLVDAADRMASDYERPRTSVIEHAVRLYTEKHGYHENSNHEGETDHGRDARAGTNGD